jgi:hypothetical protein
MVQVGEQRQANRGSEPKHLKVSVLRQSQGDARCYTEKEGKTTEGGKRKGKKIRRTMFEWFYVSDEVLG